ncbi:Glycosyltransferase Family 1 protein [Glomus cerebriforme]|uniref:Glycosyltransferase Family 1 protein n=1 Tax=Glomus cerebriforme TaxID=658196 RepID=A0A397TJZ9_9GLOM|nr:Glycosyltransferase Family 1 protein [Glomus cerebriforme]
MKKIVMSDKEVEFKGWGALLELSLMAYNNNFETYKNVAEEYNIDLFFCDAFLNDPCLDVAHTKKKPIVGFSSFLYTLAPKIYKSDPMFLCNVTLENESFLERFKCTIIQPIKLFFLTYPWVNKLNDKRKQINVEPILIEPRYVSIRKLSLFLVDTFFGFELPQPLPPHFQEIGPVMSDKYPPLQPELHDFMNKHKRILYVSLGTRVFTTAKNNNIILQSIIEAINKNLVDGAIWALVQTSKDNFSPTLNLTDGTQIQTSSILNNEHPHIYISAFAPQFSILNHTNTKLFLSHGGASSSHESLFTGIPMIVLPLDGDQVGNGEKLRLSGVALTLNKHTLDVNDIIYKIDSLLKDENVKKNVKRMKVLARINSKRKYRAADLIEYISYNSGINGGVDDKFLKEWIPADNRMGFIRGNNYDVFGVLLGIIVGLVGGTLWIISRLFKFIVKKIPSSASSKPKRE